MSAGVVRPFASPRGVTDAVRGHFCPFWPEYSLVLIRGGTLLEHYQVTAADGSLRLLHRANLYGRVHSAVVLPFAAAGDVLGSSDPKKSIPIPSGDRLVLGFGGMKVSVMRWDSASFDWRTDEILQMEHFLFQAGGVTDVEDSFGPGPSALPLTSSGLLASQDNANLAMDPLGRCVAVYGRQTNMVYFAPVRRTDAGRHTTHDPRKDLIREAEVFSVDLSMREIGVRHVKQMVFLEGFFEPTILVLFEPIPSWTGRSALIPDSHKILAMGVDVQARKVTKVWDYQHLPYDCFNLLPVPESAGGGALVFSTNLIFFLKHGKCITSLATNAFGDDFLAKSLSPSEHSSLSKEVLELDRCRSAFLDNSGEKSATKNSVVVSLKGGDLYFLKLPSGLASEPMELSRVGSTVIASKVLPFNRTKFLIASWVSDSVLVDYRKVSSGTKTDKDSKAEDTGQEDDAWMFESVTTIDTSSDTKWDLKVKDSLPGFGPAADLAVGRQPGEDENRPLEMVAAGGRDKNGCLAILRRTIRPEVLSTFQVQGCQRIFTAIDLSTNISDEQARAKRREARALNNRKLEEANKEIEKERNEWIKVETQRRREEDEKDVEEGDEVDHCMMEKEVEDAAKVRFPKQSLEVETENIGDPNKLHNFMLLSTESRTLALSSGYEIHPIERGNHDFVVDSPTFEAGNMLDDQALVQVYQGGVRLLRGAKRIHEYSLPFDSTVKFAQLYDPFVLVLLGSGDLIILEAAVTGAEEVEVDREVLTDQYGGTREQATTRSLITAELRVVLDTARREKGKIAPVSSAYLYGGHLGPITGDHDQSLVSKISHGILGPLRDTWDDMDDEERMLYGDVGKNMMEVDEDLESKGQEELENQEMDDEEMMLYADESDPSKGNSAAKATQKDTDLQISRRESYILAVVKKNGSLQLLTVPGFSVIFMSDTFFLGPRLLENMTKPTKEVDEDVVSLAEEEAATFKDSSTAERIVGISMAEVFPGMQDSSYMSASFLLIALVADGTTLLYRSFFDAVRNAEGFPVFNLKFSRISQEEVPEWKAPTQTNGIGTIRPYQDLQGRSGFFLPGSELFLLSIEKSFPRIHPVDVGQSDASVVWVSEFHNVNCDKGCIFLLNNGTVGIADMARQGLTSLEAQWAMRKVPIHRTVHKIAYHSSSDTYTVLTISKGEGSREETQQQMQQWSEKAEYRPTVLKAEQSRLPVYQGERHQVRMYRPGTWQMIKEYDLKPNEVALSLGSMAVDVYKQPSGELTEDQKRRQAKGEEVIISSYSASEKTKAKHMIVVGTGYMKGEDADCRGRLLMFEISRQQVDDFTSFQVQLIAEKELKGPASTLRPMQGYVAAGVGPKVELYKLVEDEIVCTCFFFAELFCSSLSTMKQYLLVGDMQKSVSLVYWRDRNKSMTLLGKDFEHACVYATEFLVDGDDISLVFSDANSNIQVLTYGGFSDPDARGGERLLPKGAYNLGSRINKFVRVSETMESSRQVTMFVTLDGGIYGIVPVTGRRLRKLKALQTKLMALDELPRYAGLNPVAGRFHKVSPYGLGCYKPSGNGKALTDGGLIGEYRSLTSARQTEVAKQIGMDAGGIAQEVSDLDSVLRRF